MFIRKAAICLAFCACVALPAHAWQQPQEVRVGFSLNNLYDLNMNAHSFYADFYLWFKWKGAGDPTNVEFVNAIEKWSVTNTGMGADSATTLADGTNYRIFRIEGRFLHPFELGSFPLDRHQLDIQMENPEADHDSLVYLPDTGRCAVIRPSLHLAGWDKVTAKAETSKHDYGTDFGNPEENARQYSNLTFSVFLQRPLRFFLLKMLLPLVIIIVVSLSALFLNPTYIDTRSSLPIGGLLTAVFLQQTYNDALPDMGYMVLMDKIYLLAYLIIAMILIHIIVAGNYLTRTGTHAVAEQKLVWWERRLAVVYLLVFGVLVWLMC